MPTLPHTHIDETGWSIDGVRHWLWTIATPTLTFAVIRNSRGAKVLVELLTAAYPGLISCDFWSAYRSKEGVAGSRAYGTAATVRPARLSYLGQLLAQAHGVRPTVHPVRPGTR